MHARAVSTPFHAYHSQLVSARQHRQDAGWENLLSELDDLESCERCSRCGLEDDCVATRQSWAQLPARHGERVVEGNDLPNDAYGLAHGVGKLVGNADGLAKDFVAPAAVVAEGEDSFGEICGESLSVRLAWRCMSVTTMSTNRDFAPDRYPMRQ